MGDSNLELFSATASACWYSLPNCASEFNWIHLNCRCFRVRIKCLIRMKVDAAALAENPRQASHECSLTFRKNSLMKGQFGQLFWGCCSISSGWSRASETNFITRSCRGATTSSGLLVLQLCCFLMLPLGGTTVQAVCSRVHEELHARKSEGDSSYFGDVYGYEADLYL